ncbi:MAG: TlpA family protein disulfide reductase [Calditrichaceae bacterium]|nr:TlpA family protein disulfide reductase [Calditrichia bacterium]NUQ42622.1 TlpA family protein disulfide reductase [Calditrichaceae bacterium]
MKARLILILLLTCWYFLGPAANSFADWVGTPAPDFSLKTIGNQTQIALKDYRGKAVLLDFWASWCGPCKASLPQLQKLEAEYPGLKVLAVSIDDERKNALEFMKRLNLDLTALYDENKKVAETYRVEAMPSALLIDRQGVVRYTLSGYSEKRLQELKTEIEKLTKNH